MLLGYSLPLSGTDQPSLKLLIRFPNNERNINIITKCSTEYNDLGILLLDDDNGDIVKSLEMEHHFNGEHVITEIFRRWINGTGMKPISWNILIAVLRDVDLHTLADELQDALRS